VRLFRGRNLRAQFFVGGGILEIALNVVNPFEEPIPEMAIDGLRREFLDVLGKLRAKGFRCQRVEGEANYRELRRKQMIFGQVVQCRNQLALG